MTLRTATLRRPHHRTYAGSGRNGQSGDTFLAGLGKSSAREALAALLTLIALTFCLWTGNKVKVLGDELTLLEKEHSRLVSKHEEIVTLETIRKNIDELKKIGKGLGLHPPTNNQLVTLK